MVSLMRAVHLPEAGRATTRDRPDPVPEGENVVIRVEAACLCGSDLHGLYERPGEKRFTPGHECAGVVVAVDAPRVVGVGDRVCLNPALGCGVCEVCRAGYYIYCCSRRGLYGFDLDGCQSELMCVSERCLLPIPDCMGFETGALLLDPVGTPYHAHKRIGTNATHTVGVFGLGPMGLGATMVAAALGARVLAVDPIAYRRELAKTVGAADLIDPMAGDAVAEIRELTDGYGLDRALECSGNPQALTAALDSMRHFGHLALIGEGGDARIRPSRHFNGKELSLSGSRCYPAGEHEEICRFAGSLPVGELVTHRFGFEQAAEAYAAFAGGRTGKVLFVPRETDSR
jgi:propanol-preferring alcohol dehydrogenase